MKQKLTSLRLRILLPVIIMTLFVVILLTTMFSHGYTDMLIRQAQRMNAVSFDTVSQSVVPLIDLSIDEVRKIIMDERVRSYARLQYASEADLIHARISCRDYLRGELSRQEAADLIKQSSRRYAKRQLTWFKRDPQARWFLWDREPDIQGAVETIVKNEE